ncbi:translocation/assembly module TamB domain-containing protein [Palleniella muris]|uniref:translocation/assembly module TamB domain-containing protein n=1 Tax=Palleniella muris TaxID=3038145 RepID=UPI001093C7F2|nr:translocation/assembly module TamB domain-containing protein [Palleniella muris]
MKVSNLNLCFLNRIIIDNVLIQDRQKKEMLACHRISAKIDVLPLLKGKISISSAQIFGMHLALYRQNGSSPLNCQFVIDSLASKDTTKHTPLDLHIASLVIRNSSVNYDRNDMAHKVGFDVNHVALDKISGHIMLYALTDDSLSVKMKKLSFDELNSKLSLKNLSFVADANKHRCSINDFNLRTAESDITLNAMANYKGNRIQSFHVVSKNSYVGLKDAACFEQRLSKFDSKILFDVNIDGKDKSLNIHELTIRTSDNDFMFKSHGNVVSRTSVFKALPKPETLTFNLHSDIHASTGFVSDVMSVFGADSPILGRLGTIDYSATAEGNYGKYILTGDLATGVGILSHKLSYADKFITADISTPQDFRLGYLLNTRALGNVKFAMDADAIVAKNPKTGKFTLHAMDSKVNIPYVIANGYEYRNVKLESKLNNGRAEMFFDIADMNANGNVRFVASDASSLLEGKPKELCDIEMTAEVAHLNPYALGILTADTIPHGPLSFTFQASTTNVGYGHTEIKFESDFANAFAEGEFDPFTIQQTFTNLVAKRLPTLPGMPMYKATNNRIELDASVTDMKRFGEILGVNFLSQEPLTLVGYVNEPMKSADISISAPQLEFSGRKFADTRLHVYSLSDTLYVSGGTSRVESDGTNFLLSLQGKVADNRLLTAIDFDNGRERRMCGTVNTNSQFFRGLDGKPVVNVSVLPSEIQMGDSLWNLRSSDIVYTAYDLSVDNFVLEHGLQCIKIDGAATRSMEDSLVVDMQGVDVAYIMNLIDFHSVEFGGFVTGKAVVKSLFSTPTAYSDIDVQDFRFQYGRMGILTCHAKWDNELGQININAVCNDDNVTPEVDGRLGIDGYISLKNNYIDLGMKAENTRFEFLQSFCESFMKDVKVYGTGDIRLYGPLNKINLTGDAVVNGSTVITPLNTEYTLKNDTVHFVPNDIRFADCVFYDKYGNRGAISGGLHHKNLGKMTFDLDVKAEHLLCYDFPTLDGSTFCGRVVGTGNCKITGRSGEIVFDIDAYPEETSEFTYNVSSPDALQNQSFITWKSKEEKGNIMQQDSTLSATIEQKHQLSTNIRMNFLVHITPESTIQLLMDQRTGDYIKLNGSGDLRATYFNKGGLHIFGNYNVEDGEYKMTIQKVLSKNFTFLPGSSISFGGEPFQALVNLKAQYIVPSVPLSDLNIGNSFKNNSVRVNCLMNITGTAEHPMVDFDLNLPQASADIQQMITSIIDSEQERNQQVVYLLSIGRFYSDNTNASSDPAAMSQGSLAMQSFLSGTVSQQINNIISDMVLKNSDWNFGANISPGDEGMNNAEYEGLVSGRMFNNRLQINGQFGYRDNKNATTSFIGDFDVRYLLFPNGNLSVRVYNQTTDRYFTKSSLNTQGLGIEFKHDFNSFIPGFLRKKKKSILK